MTSSREPGGTLRARDALALTVGIVIGAGIFRAPAAVAAAAGSAEAMLAAWAAGGLLSILGALCYAELAAAFPHSGGDYHFLERAFGGRIAFFHAWARLSVIQTGSLALLAYVVGDYLNLVAPLGRAGPAWWAAATVVLVSGVNWAGVRLGAGVQRWLTIVEVAGLVALIAAGFAVAPAAAPALPAPVGETNIGLALVFVLLTYGGWSETAYLSAELGAARRRIAAVLVGGLGLVTALYLLANLAFLRALGFAGLQGAEAVGAAVMERALGPAGAAAISLAVAIAALTSANATAITGARGAAALGANLKGGGWLARWDVARGTPGNAVLVQAAVALALVTAGAFSRDGFALAVDYTAPVFWLFLSAVGVAFFMLRRREPNAPRPFRVPLYPVVPALFLGTSAFMLWSSLAYAGRGALVGVAVLAAGALLLPLVRQEVRADPNPTRSG